MTLTFPPSVIFRSIANEKRGEKKIRKNPFNILFVNTPRLERREPRIISGPQREKGRNKKNTTTDKQLVATHRDEWWWNAYVFKKKKKLRRTISADFSFDDGRTERRASCFSPHDVVIYSRGVANER